MIDFDTFCTRQFLSAEDRRAFKQWLGKTADARMSESSWLQWFARWVRGK